MPDLALFLSMPQVFEDDEWKHIAAPQPTITRMSRAQMQTTIDADYAHGRISLEEWRQITDTLSEPSMKATTRR